MVYRRCHARMVGQPVRSRLRSAHPHAPNRPPHHGFHFRKLAISRKPSRWLFSGWNWVPTMESRPTTAVTGPP